MTTSTASQILFIDSRVANADSLLAGIDSTIEIVWLSADHDGLEQIADTLAGRSGISAVHVVSHGGPGYLSLGAGIVDSASLAGHMAQMDTIRAALADSADLLLYGCNVADGDAGAAFIDALAGATGADVAASTDATGSAVLGGDWVLEAATGAVETTALEAPAYESILAPGNAGFESDFSGWVTSDAVIGTGAVYSAGSNQWTVNPYGAKMAVVQPAGGSGELSGVYSALQVGSAAQTYLNTRFSNPTNFGYVYTDVTLAAGETFDMAWNYVATDYSPFNDASWVSVVNRSNTGDTSMSIRPGAGSAFVGGQVSILGATVTGTGNYVTGNYGSTGWQTVTITAGEAGTYRIGFAVFNLADTILSPYLFVDQAAGSTLKNGTPFGPVPAPAVLPPPPVAPNAAPVISGTSYTAGSNTFTDTAGNDSFSTTVGKVNATDADGNALSFVVAGGSSSTTKATTYGTFTITDPATGAFTYAPNNAAIQALKSSVIDSFTVTVSDGKGGTASTTVSFTLAGANDTTVFTGTATGAVQEDGTSVATGTVATSDRDSGDAAIVPAAMASVYGVFVVNASGQWTYTLSQNASAVQSLNAGVVAHDSFTIHTAGGATQTVTIDITGVNDLPTLSSAATMLTLAEDANPANGQSIANLFGGRFSDADAGSSFGGILISANAASAAQGAWYYKAVGDAGWSAIPTTGLSTSSALALAKTTLIKFVPAQDYNGNPGALTVFATDDQYLGGFTLTGGDEVSSATSVGGVSVAGTTLSISISAVNDAPVFVTGDIAESLIETSATDALGELAGTLADSATDVENDALTYAIQGGSSVGGASVLQGTYGKLTLAPGGAWTYTPNKSVAINALDAGETGVDAFTLKVTDPSGASAIKTLSVSITGANDLPILQADVITDQGFSGAGTWTYQIPVSAITDAEGTGLTYTATLVDGDGNPVDLDGDGGNPAGTLPAWLNFDAATRTFTGNPPKNLEGTTLNLQVTVADNHGESVTDTFSVTLGASLNDVPSGNVTIANQTSAGRGTATLQQGDVLAAANTLADGDGLGTITYTWYANGAAIGTGATHTLGQADVGKVITVVASYTDVGGVAEAVGSAPTAVVVEVNDAPAGEPSAVLAAGTEDNVYIVNPADLLAGFSDADGDGMSVASLTVTSPGGAIVATNLDGTYSITLPANFNGPVALSYAVVDGKGGTVNASQSFAVTAVNDAPTGSASFTLAAGTEDESCTVNAADLLQGFSDVEGGTLQVVNLQASHGSVKDNGDGTFTITPAANYNGPVTLSYQVIDGNGGKLAGGASQSFTVDAVDDAPALISVLTTQTTSQGVALTPFSIAGKFDDGDGSTLNFKATLADGSPLPAWLLFDETTGTFSGTPGAGDVGAIGVKVTAYDGAEGTGLSTPASFVLNVAALPTTTDVTLSASEDKPYVFSGADFNFSQADGSPLAVVRVELPVNGVLKLDGVTLLSATDVSAADINNGKLSFVPDADITGSAAASFTFRVGDGLTFSAAHTASLDFAPANDAPTATNLTQSVHYTAGTSAALGDIVVSEVDGDVVTAVLTLDTPVAGALSTGTFGAATSTYNATSGTWSVTGLVADVNAALAAVSFVPAANWTADVSVSTLIRDAAGTGPAIGSLTLTSSGAVAVDMAQSALPDSTPNDVWNNVFDTANTLSGFTTTVHVIVTATNGFVKLDNSTPEGSMAIGSVVASTGYGNLTDGTATSIAFDGTLAEVNAALQYLQYERTSGDTGSVSINAVEGGSAYNPDSGHYYVAVEAPGGISWQDAKTAAEGMTFNGMQGYLATITSAEENAFILSKLPADGWIGGSDAEQEGVWKWVTGPEAGTTFSQGDFNPVTEPGQYANWADGEPNGDNHSEDYAEFYASSGSGEWNDLNGYSLSYYVVEFGGLPGQVANQLISRTFTANATPAPAAAVVTATNLTQNVPFTEGDASVALGDIVVSDSVVGDTVTAILTLDTPVAGVLTVGTFGSATATYNASTGQWTVTGSVADVNAALADVSFVPATDWDGSATISTLIRGSAGAGPTIGTITLGATPVNDAPTGAGNTVTMLENGTQVLTLVDFSTGYADTEGDALAAVKITATPLTGSLEYDSGAGWVAVSADDVISAADIVAGKLHFIPAANTSGAANASFDFKVGDGAAFSASAYTVTVNVTATSAPKLTGAPALLAAGTEDTAYTVSAADLLAGYTDPNGGTLLPVNLIADHGTVVANADGSFTIHPAANYNGPVTLSYSVIDGQGSSVAASQSFTLSAVDDAPLLSTPMSDQVALQGKALVPFSVAGNFTNTDGGALNFKATLADGTALPAWLHFDEATGQFSGTPDSSYVGAIGVKVTACDGVGATGLETPATFLLTVTSTPVATNDSVSTVKNQPIVLSMGDFGDYSDPEGGAQQYVIITALPTHGTLEFDGVAITPDDLANTSGGLPGTSALPVGETGYWVSVADILAGKLSFTPDEGYAGSTDLSFKVEKNPISYTSYTLAIDVADTNDAPTLQSAPAVLGLSDEDAPRIVLKSDLLQGYADPESAQLDVVGLTADHGTVIDNGNGTYTVTPALDYNGLITLTYAVSDGVNSLATDLSYNLAPVNDAPVLVNPVGDKTLADVQDGITLPNDIFTDVDGDSLTVTPKLADGSDLPGWLTWNDGTLSLTGTPPGGTPYVDILLSADDSNGGTATSTFRLSLTTGAAGTGVETSNHAGVVTVSANNPAVGGIYAAGTVLTATVSDIDGFVADNVVYQWQISADGINGWSAIPGASAAELTLGLTESNQFVRVTAYYTDGGNILETPVSSPALQVELQDHAGAVTISGTPAAGYTLAATLTDVDGLTGALPTYVWKADGVTVQSGTSNAYTLTNNEGGKTMSVFVTYTDDAGFSTTLDATDATPIQIGVMAPVPAVQTAEATEQSGIANAVAGSTASGDLLAGATDANEGDAISFDSVRTGSVAGLGSPALLDPLDPAYVLLNGSYGQLRVKLADGTYTYTPFDNAAGVQQLRAGQAATDDFNYSLRDQTDLVGTSTLSITVHGADDAPAGSGLPATATVTEDETTAIDLSALALSDVDGLGSDTYTVTVSAATDGAALTATGGDGVVVAGSGTGSLTLTGSLASLNSYIDSATALHYTGKADDDTADTLTVTLQDVSTAGKPLVSLGTIAVDLTPVNDAPTLDLDANNSSGAAGSGYTTAYTARSNVLVKVVDSDITIHDADSVSGTPDTITMATLAIATGALDNLFGSYETLQAQGASVVVVDGETRFTFANYDAADASTYLVVAGNNTAKLTFIGTGSWAQYQDALNSVYYGDANPNATAGVRTITVSIQDGSVTTSDADSLSTIATTALTVLWAPSVDLDGEATANVDDRDYAVTYTENGPAVAIAASDASISDLDGNIKQVQVTLRADDAGAPIGAEDVLTISNAFITLLASKGVTTVVSGDGHTITFTGNVDGSPFQLGLRAVQYHNTSESPTQALVRYVDVTTIDMQDHVGVSATTTISIAPVNDAPAAFADVVTVGEAGGVQNGTAGVNPLGNNVLDNDTDIDAYKSSTPAQAETQAVSAVSFELTSGTVGQPLAGQYGSLTLNADGTYVYEVDNDNATVQALRSAGDTLTEVFHYTMVDSGGLTSSSTLTVTLTGANDTPAITVQTGGGAAEGVSESNATLTTSGTLSVEDVDLLDSVTASVVSVVASGTIAGLGADNATLRSMLHVDAGAIIDATHTTGTLHWNFDSATTQTVFNAGAYANAMNLWMVGGMVGASPNPDAYTTTLPYNEAFNYLSAGEQLTLTYTVRASDGTATTDHNVVVTVTGTNDAPVVASIAQHDLTEQADTGALTTSVTVSFTDVDLTDTGHAVSVTAATASGDTDGLALDEAGLIALVTPGLVTKNTGSSGGTVDLAFSAASTQFDYLAAGQVLTLTYTATVDDGDTGVTTQDFVVTITGTTDAPLLDAVDAGGSITEGSVLSDTGSITFTDVDLTDLPTATSALASLTALKSDGETPLALSGAQQTALTNAFSLAAAEGNTHDGTINWTYSITESALNFLAAGEQVTAVFTVTVDDGNGGTADQNVTVTLTGTNDVPVLSAVDVVGELSEAGGSGTLSDTGSITFADLDLTDLPTASYAVKSLVPLKHDGSTPLTLTPDQLTALTDAFTLTAGGSNTNDGSIGWTYAIGEADVDFLGEGDTVTAVFTVTVADGKGGLATQDVSVTLTGTNDAPILDLNGNGYDGTGASVLFNARGDAIALFDQDGSGNLTLLNLADKDDGDLLQQVVLTLDPDQALDNLGTTYETLFSTKGSGTFSFAGDSLTISGNGTSGSPLTISGVGSVAAYKAALASLKYIDTNQNAYAGPRDITVTVTDVGTTLPSATSNPLSTSATLTVSVTWNPVTDLNGPGTLTGLPHDANAQRDYVVTYTEKQPTVAYIASSTATLFDQNGLIQKVVVDLTNPLDGTSEVMSVDAGVIATLESLGISTTVSNSNHTVTFEAIDALGRDVSQFQIGLRAVQYKDLSNAPDESAQREISVMAYDTDGSPGVGATSYINVVGVNVPPTLQAVAAGSVTETALASSWTDSGLSGTLIGADEDLQTLAYGIDGGATGGSYQPAAVTYDVSKAGSYGTLYVSSASGDYLYVPDADAVDGLAVSETATESFTVTVSDGVAANVTRTFTIDLSGANDAPTIVVADSDAIGGVTERADGALDENTGNLTDTGVVAFADVDLTDTHTVNLAATVKDAEGLELAAPLGSLALGELNATDKTVGWTFSVAADLLDSLPEGQTLTQVYSITVADSQGSSVEQTVTVTITGTNDAPTIVALSTDSTGDVTEDSAVDALSGKLSTTGSIAFNDIDLIDTHTGMVVADAANTLGGTLTLSAVSEDAATEGGSFGWTYEVANSATQYLAAGETAT
ncbi:MAG: tandem-95 repeat protein, partial [Zoogloea sp.]|uniref:tandem-95 repeat protein n=1 Tax=Zoogloea sp. TaxID=49181 RepID=UPI00262F9F54